MSKGVAIPGELATDILELLNRAKGKIDTVREIGRLIKKSTGIDAVGVRLKEGDDFPYYVTCGFPAVFVEAENSLCARDPSGEPIRDSAGNPVLECMCGNIIQGRTDHSLPFFTEGGSFWTNSTTELLASTTEEDRQARTRNRCNAEGYESVALIPLRSDGEIIGLLQLDDCRRDVFTRESIAFFEKLGESIGIAIARRKAEAETRGRELYLRSLLDHLLEAVVVVGPDHRITDFNKATVTLSGYRNEEIIGRPCYQILHGYDKPCDRYGETCRLQAVFETGKPCSYEHTHRRKDGSRIWKYIQLSPLRDVEGKIIRVIHAVRDITDLKKSQVVIEELSKFPAEDPNPVLRVTKDGVIIYANRSSAPLLKLWKCKVGQPLPEKLRKAAGDAFGSGRRREAEVICGNRFISLTFTPITETDYINIYGLDITERKKVEEAEGFKRFNQAITEFMEAERKRVALDLHDEVGQLLTAIQMGLEMLLLDHPDLGGQVEKEVRSTVDLVERAGNEVHRISSRLRPETLEDFGLIPSIEHEIEFLKVRSKIEFEFSARGLEKRLDPQKEILIYRVVQESLTNIMKHSEAGKVEVTLNRKGGRILLKVLDNGRGFNLSELDETTGLGVMGMRERIEAVGGSFRITTQPGDGTLLEAEVPAG